MPLRNAGVAQVEQEIAGRALPRRVYFIEESTGVYVPAVGTIGEADAYLMEETTGVFVLADDADDEDRVAYLTDTSTVIV